MKYFGQVKSKFGKRKCLKHLAKLTSRGKIEVDPCKLSCILHENGMLLILHTERNILAALFKLSNYKTIDMLLSKYTEYSVVPISHAKLAECLLNNGVWLYESKQLYLGFFLL